HAARHAPGAGGLDADGRLLGAAAEPVRRRCRPGPDGRRARAAPRRAAAARPARRRRRQRRDPGRPRSRHVDGARPPARARDARGICRVAFDSWPSAGGVAEPARLARPGRWGSAPARLVVRELQAAAGPDPAPAAAPDPAPDLEPWTVDELMVTTIAATIGP